MLITDNIVGLFPIMSVFLGESILSNSGMCIWITLAIGTCWQKLGEKLFFCPAERRTLLWLRWHWRWWFLNAQTVFLSVSASLAQGLRTMRMRVNMKAQPKPDMDSCCNAPANRKQRITRILESGGTLLLLIVSGFFQVWNILNMRIIMNVNCINLKFHHDETHTFNNKVCQIKVIVMAKEVRVGCRDVVWLKQSWDREQSEGEENKKGALIWPQVYCASYQTFLISWGHASRHPNSPNRHKYHNCCTFANHN